MGSATERGRLSRQDWIEAALDVLAERGIEGVRIDRLCERIAMTKGSFYHHFDGREDLLDAVADYWANTQPKASVAVFEDPQLEPVERLAAVSRLVTERGSAAATTPCAPGARRTNAPPERFVTRIARSWICKSDCSRTSSVPADEVQPLAQVLFFATIGALRLTHPLARGLAAPARELFDPSGAGASSHMTGRQRTGLGNEVSGIANATLFPRTDFWWTGANIAGKPRYFSAYLFGSLYSQRLSDVANKGYAGFVFEPAQRAERRD